MTLKKMILFCALVAVSLSCAQKRPHFEGKTEGEKLNHFFEWSFKSFLQKSPEEMTYLGMQQKQGQLNQYSYAFDKEMVQMVETHLSFLQSFDYDQLNEADQLSYNLYQKSLQDKVKAFQWRDYHYPVNPMFSVHSRLPSFMMNMHRVKTEKDLENYLQRLGQFKRVFSEVINNLMRSENAGVVLPKFAFPMIIDDSKNIISGIPFDKSKKDSPLFNDFKQKLKKLKLSKTKEAQLLKQGQQALVTSVQPAYQQLIDFLQKQSLRASADDGAWKFPKGSQFYQYALQKMTTTSLTPDEIHELGLKNVARIHKEMTAIAKKVKFKGDLQKFFKFMQSEKFLFKNNKRGKKQYLRVAKKYITDMKAKLDALFLTQPKADIVVKPVEAFREKSAGMAFYQNATPDGSRPGTYYVNLYNMKALPRWEAEALAYHEGIPGHHMQISIAQELKNVPMFRKYGHYTSYIEGWGLYSEKIPKELGFYKDPYSDFGRLSMELTRACRLVVDTGIHYKKWTRQQAIDYLDKNLPGDHDDNVRQITRYTVWPGQATAYMVGMLKILELREKAKSKMGDRFDIRKFHDVILTNGPLPLGILEQQVDAYIKR